MIKKLWRWVFGRSAQPRAPTIGDVIAEVFARDIERQEWESDLPPRDGSPIRRRRHNWIGA
jgi:hypothetical protein